MCTRKDKSVGDVCRNASRIPTLRENKRERRVYCRGYSRIRLGRGRSGAQAFTSIVHQGCLESRERLRELRMAFNKRGLLRRPQNQTKMSEYSTFTLRPTLLASVRIRLFRPSTKRGVLEDLLCRVRAFVLSTGEIVVCVGVCRALRHVPGACVTPFVLFILSPPTPHPATPDADPPRSWQIDGTMRTKIRHGGL